MTDVDDDVSASAASLLPGGPPWLVEQVAVAAVVKDDEPESAVQELAVVEPVETPDVSRPSVTPVAAPVPGPHAGAVASLTQSLERERRTVAAVRAESAQIQQSLDVAENLLRKAQATIEQLRTQKRAQLKKSRRGSRDESRLDHLFPTPEERLRHDVYVAWVEKIPAGEKGARPLPAEWGVGSDFCASLERMRAEVQGKIPMVIVEVLVGIAQRSEGREVHPLRSSVGGDAPPVVRADGATCMRVAVQRGAPSAARLHYWKLDHGIELSRVVLHDDMTP